MTPGRPSPAVRAAYYDTVTTPDREVELRLVEGELTGVEVRDGMLVAEEVVVVNRAVLVAERADGELYGIACDPIELRDGALCFDPSRGGVRTRDNRRARGAFNHLVAEAHRFAMINAFVHARRAARFANDLLERCDAKQLPQVTVVVGAHYGSRLGGYCSGDGDLRTGSLRPLSGGHYRVSQRVTGVPEQLPVAATGEIHLGPCRYRKPFAGSASYLRNAAHNPAIIYHEYGHHLCRHTVDFRLNSQRPHHDQRNGKPGIEEGICDYFTAALLQSGRAYGWYRADRGRRRDMEQLRVACGDDDRTDDPHSIGAPWATAWWHCRNELVHADLIADESEHDRILVDMLLRIAGSFGSDEGRPSVAGERRRTRGSTVTRAYRDAVRESAGKEAARMAMSIFEQAGLRSPRVARQRHG